MSGISDSAKFNATSSYYFPSDANTASGVISLNGLAGVVSVSSPDNSLSVAAAGPLINVSTTGQAQAPSTVAATGAVSSTVSLTAPKAILANSYTTQANVVAAQNVNTAIGPVITKPCRIEITIFERVYGGGVNNRTESGFLYYNAGGLTGGLTYYRYNQNTGGNITLVWGQAPNPNQWTFGSSASGGCDVIATVTVTNLSP